MVSSEHNSTSWYKSSYSGGSNADCLEVARGHACVPVRDSKVIPGPTLLFSTDGWANFVAAVKHGRLHH
jgi:hypothetical protein